jgi:hypothetical protein
MCRYVWLLIMPLWLHLPYRYEYYRKAESTHVIIQLCLFSYWDKWGRNSYVREVNFLISLFPSLRRPVLAWFSCFHSSGWFSSGFFPAAKTKTDGTIDMCVLTMCRYVRLLIMPCRYLRARGNYQEQKYATFTRPWKHENKMTPKSARARGGIQSKKKKRKNPSG